MPTTALWVAGAQGPRRGLCFLGWQSQKGGREKGGGGTVFNALLGRGGVGFLLSSRTPQLLAL